MGKVAIIITLLALAGCSTHTISIGPDSINATSTSFLYCPEARVIRAQDGKRSVDMVGEASGVGAVVRDVVGAIK